MSEDDGMSENDKNALLNEAFSYSDGYSDGYAKGVRDERERCAKIAEEHADEAYGNAAEEYAGRAIAAAIRDGKIP